MKIEMRWLGWGAVIGWRCSLQEPAGRAADCSLANDPFSKLISNEEFSLMKTEAA